MKNNLKIISMDTVAREEVKWLWYPYIPQRKVTIIQGDPGEGKTTLVLALVSLLTKGLTLPESEVAEEPMNVIYQTAEDGLGDTIKPRLESLGADCCRVMVIDESEQELTLSDQRLAEAIRQTGAKLAILDPIQAYLGGGVDMHRANEVRPIFKNLCQLAEQTGCAIVLIGHMNKAQGAKSNYRGLGSIDFQAAARSVLVVGRAKDDATMRIMAHCKSSLAPEGKSIAFALHPELGFQWKGFCETTVDDLLSGNGSAQTKTAQMEEKLKNLLTEPMSAEEVSCKAKALGISHRTLMTAKKNLGVLSVREGERWFWRLPDQECKGVSL